MGVRIPVAVSRFARKARCFGVDGGRGCCGGFSLLLFRGFTAKSAALWDGRVRYCRAALSRPHFWSVSPPQITLGILARTIARATLAIAVSGRGEIPHWR